MRRDHHARRSGALRGAVPEESRPHRRHHRHAAEFRRRARHRRYPAPGRSERAGADPGHPGYARPHDHQRPPRQLLRQDVGLQQPEAVRHSLFAHHPAHRSAGFRRVPRRIWTGSPPYAAWCAGCGACAWAPSARGRRPSTPCATARNCSKPTASPSRPSTFPRSWAASAHEGRRRGGRQAKLAAIKRYVTTERRARSGSAARWPSWAR